MSRLPGHITPPDQRTAPSITLGAVVVCGCDGREVCGPRARGLARASSRLEDGLYAVGGTARGLCTYGLRKCRRKPQVGRHLLVTVILFGFTRGQMSMARRALVVREVYLPTAVAEAAKDQDASRFDGEKSQTARLVSDETHRNAGKAVSRAIASSGLAISRASVERLAGIENAPQARAAIIVTPRK